MDNNRVDTLESPGIVVTVLKHLLRIMREEGVDAISLTRLEGAVDAFTQHP